MQLAIICIKFCDVDSVDTNKIYHDLTTPPWRLCADSFREGFKAVLIKPA